MLEGYVGQRDTIQPLLVAINAARVSGRPLPHSLFLGRAGTGKTTLAHAVAAEVGVPFSILHGSSTIEQEVIAERIMAAQGGILFLDEVHALPRQLCENLYRLHDEDRISVSTPIMKIKRKHLYVNNPMMLPVGYQHQYVGAQYYDIWYQEPTKQMEAKVVNVRHVTIIGSTTDEALLPQPFYSRLSGLVIRLRPYTIDELAEIITHHVWTFGMSIDRETAEYLASRARETPRKAKQLAERAIDRAVQLESVQVFLACAKAAVDSLGIDEHGLEDPQRRILSVLGEHERGLSRTSLSQILGIPPRNLEMYWQDLQQDGLVMIDTRHRLTEKGRSYIG